MGSSRAEDYADRFEKELAEFIKTVEAVSDEQWRKVCGDEGWTVAATAHHVGFQWPLERELLEGAVGNTAMPAYTWDDVNARNEKHAQDFGACSKADALSILREGGPGMAAFVRGLSDEQLDRAAPFPLANNASLTPAQLIGGGVLIEHVTGHLKSIRAAQ